MTRIFAGLIAAAMIALLGACGVDEQDAGPPEDFTPGSIDELVNTEWRFEEFELAFQDPPEVIVRGEPIRAEFGLDDVTGEYAVDDSGFVEITVEIGDLNEIRMGTWDGEQLIIDGITGQRLD